jgi:hypothetical protein
MNAERDVAAQVYLAGAGDRFALPGPAALSQAPNWFESERKAPLTPVSL